MREVFSSPINSKWQVLKSILCLFFFWKNNRWTPHQSRRRKTVPQPWLVADLQAGHWLCWSFHPKIRPEQRREHDKRGIHGHGWSNGLFSPSGALLFHRFIRTIVQHHTRTHARTHTHTNTHANKARFSAVIGNHLCSRIYRHFCVFPMSGTEINDKPENTTKINKRSAQKLLPSLTSNKAQHTHTTGRASQESAL